MHVVLLVKEGGYTIAAESLTCQERDFAEGKNHMDGVKIPPSRGRISAGGNRDRCADAGRSVVFDWCSQVSEVVFLVFLYRRRSIEQNVWVITVSYLSP